MDDDAVTDTESGDSSGNDQNEDGTAEHPFNGIQEAIEVGRDGVAIMVHPGSYRESIDLLTKNVRLIGIDPDDPAPQSWPVIEGDGPRTGRLLLRRPNLRMPADGVCHHTEQRPGSRRS